MKSNPVSLLMRMLLLPLVLALPPALRADCAPAVEALQKAWRIERIAQYDVESPDEKPAGRPFVVRIGNTVWTNLGDGSSYHRANAPSENPMVISMKAKPGSGGRDAQCSAAGAGVLRGEAAVKYRIDGALGGSTTGAIILWVSRSRGLPLFHEFTKLSPGGYAWVYGDAVQPPPAGQQGK